MKRFLTLLLSLALALSLTACSDSSTDTGTTAAAGTGDAEETTTSAPIGTQPERVPISEDIPYVDGDAYYEFDCSKDLDPNGFYAAFDAAEYVTLPENLTVTVPYNVHTAAQADVDAEIEDIIDFYATDEQIMDRAVADGDTINIDYVGTLNGEAFQGGSTNGYGTTVTVGVTNYVDDFLKKLVGHKPGETFDIDIHFPEDYGNAELAGKDTVFNVTINYIAGDKIMPELTDAFVAEKLAPNYGWTTVEEMRTSISEDLAKQAVHDHIYSYLLDNSTVSSVPDGLTVYMKNYFIYYHSYLAKGNEVTLPQLLSNFGFATMSDMLADYEQDIASACKEELIVQAAAKKLNVSITEQDLQDYFMEELGRTDYSAYETSFGLPYVKKMVLSWKVVNLLKEQATFLPQ